jgi:hypothetical protein
LSGRAPVAAIPRRGRARCTAARRPPGRPPRAPVRARARLSPGPLPAPPVPGGGRPTAGRPPGCVAACGTYAATATSPKRATAVQLTQACRRRAGTGPPVAMLVAIGSSTSMQTPATAEATMRSLRHRWSPRMSRLPDRRAEDDVGNGHGTLQARSAWPSPAQHLIWTRAAEPQLRAPAQQRVRYGWSTCSPLIELGHLPGRSRGRRAC